MLLVGWLVIPFEKSGVRAVGTWFVACRAKYLSVWFPRHLPVLSLCFYERFAFNSSRSRQVEVTCDSPEPGSNFFAFVLAYFPEAVDLVAFQLKKISFFAFPFELFDESNCVVHQLFPGHFRNRLTVQQDGTAQRNILLSGFFTFSTLSLLIRAPEQQCGHEGLVAVHAVTAELSIII